MIRSKPYYSKKQIRTCIESENISITESAKNTAKDSLGWSIEDIKKALLVLPQRCCYKAETRFDNPKIWVDYYRAMNICGENIYTHFYIMEGTLIIDSFKELRP